MKFKLLTAMLLCAAPLLAQPGVSTPYSMYGYGILGDRATSMQRQMGGVGYAMNSGRQINAMNPASYAAIDSLTFLFDMGADLSFLWSKENDTSGNTIGGGLDYVTMGFPLGKYMGGSIGLLPYSSVGYAFGNSVTNGTVESQGSGGINELYLGIAGGYKGFSLGFNISYDFGNIVNDDFATGDNNNYKAEGVMKIRDWNILIGAQYAANLTRNDRLSLGVTYSPRKTFLGTTWVTLQELSQDSYPTEIAFENLKGKYYQPHSVGAGINFSHEKVSRFSVEFDYTWQGWKNAPYPDLYMKGYEDLPKDQWEIAMYGMNFNNREKFALGGEFTPKVRGTYMQRVAYRLGGYFCKDYLIVKGNSVREAGISAGLGFPTIEGKTIINVGFEWKMREAYPETLIRENYFNITLGVNFNEVWFFKRKIR